MVNIKKAVNCYKPNGDLVCNWYRKSASEYLVSEEGPGSERIIPLAMAHPHPWDALDVFDIASDQIQVMYKCPYTGYKFYTIIPSALILNGDYKYDVRCQWPEFVMDWEFYKNVCGTEKLLELSDIQKLLLGSGYTNMTSVSDGIRSIIQRRVMLDNGDALWCSFWEWYNK